MKIENHLVILYPQEDGAWVAEIPVIEGCYALMPTPEEALGELQGVFRMISEERNEE